MVISLFGHYPIGTRRDTSFVFRAVRCGRAEKSFPPALFAFELGDAAVCRCGKKAYRSLVDNVAIGGFPVSTLSTAFLVPPLLTWASSFAERPDFGQPFRRSGSGRFCFVVSPFVHIGYGQAPRSSKTNVLRLRLFGHFPHMRSRDTIGRQPLMRQLRLKC